MDFVTIALAKGRLADQAVQILKNFQIGTCIDPNSRKLVFEDETNRIRYIYVKPSDVITYVQKGVADLGIVGKDILLEEEGDVYEIFDLGFGRCKFSIAGKSSFKSFEEEEVLKVATKYPKITRQYFRNKNQDIEIIKLNGSVELAPVIGLSHVIVDIVETGNTLKANGLEILEDMFEISARLICNKISYRFKLDKIREIVSYFEVKEEMTS